jgi:hypothetical protein
MCLSPNACQAGSVEVTPATEDTPAVCKNCQAGTHCAGGSAPAIDCGDGTWDDDHNPATPCVEWTVCTWAGGGEAKAGTATADRTCGTPSAYRQFGTSDNDAARAIAVDESGNVYVVGDTYGALSGTNAGDADAFIRKYNASGTEQWTQQFGTDMTDGANAIAVDMSGNAYVVGNTGGALSGTSAGGADAFIRKYDSSGTEQWTRQFGTSSDDWAHAIAVDASGNAYVAGTTYGVLGATNAGFDDAFIRKYDSNGTEQWTQQFGSTGYDNAYGIALDAGANAYVAGSTFGASDGTNAGDNGAFIRRYSSNGTEQWTEQFGASFDSAQTIAVDASGNVYVMGNNGGEFTNFTDTSLGDGGGGFFIRKYNANRTEQWTQQFTGTPNCGYHAIAVDAGGNLYLVGCTGEALNGTNAGGYDAFIRKYNPSGSEQWTQEFGTPHDDEALGVALDASGNAYVAGCTYVAGSTFSPSNVSSMDALVTQILAH